MKLRDFLILGIGAFCTMFFANVLAMYVFKGNNAGKFDLSTEQISKDLDGRSVNLLLNQVWPFDASQNINIRVLNKKSLDEYVVVIVEVDAIAPIQQDTPQKEQFSTNPKDKETKPASRLPSKLKLAGRMKLTYEVIGNDWYLLSAENLTLKAIPIN